MKPMTLVRAALGAAPLLLGACAGLLHSSAAPEQTYYLRAPQPQSAAAAAGATSLRVAHPVADPGLDTSHIMLLQPDHRMSFFTGARWPAPLADVVGALMVQTLRASGHWQSVQGPESAFPSDYLLQVTIRRFDADYASANTAPEVRVVLECAVGRREGREVLSTFVAEGHASATANRLGEVVGAFEAASQSALTALTAQALAAVSADGAHRAAQNATMPAPSSSLHSQ